MEVDEYIFVYTGICELTNCCHCLVLNDIIVTKENIPPLHDGCSCYVISRKFIDKLGELGQKASEAGISFREIFNAANMLTSSIKAKGKLNNETGK